MQEKRRCLLPELQVVVEQQHRRQGRGEVINPGLHLLKFLSVCQQVAEKLLRLHALAKFFPRQGRVVSHLAESADAHFLEIALEVRGGEPMPACGFFIVQPGARAAEPVMDVALVGEQVFGLAQIAW